MSKQLIQQWGSRWMLAGCSEQRSRSQEVRADQGRWQRMENSVSAGQEGFHSGQFSLWAAETSPPVSCPWAWASKHIRWGTECACGMTEWGGTSGWELGLRHTDCSRGGGPWAVMGTQTKESQEEVCTWCSRNEGGIKAFWIEKFQK